MTINRLATTPTRLPGLAALALLLTLALTLTTPALAQKKRYMGEVDVCLGGGAAVLRWPTFQAFLDSYHAVNKADLGTAATLPLAGVQSLSVRTLGCIELRYERLMGSSSSTFTNSVQRTFTVRQNMFVMGIEPVFRGEHLFIGPTLGLGAGETRVATSLQYADGTVSWGRERRLTGSYSVTSLALAAGLRTGYQWQRALLAVRLEWVPTGKATVSLDDNLPGNTARSLPTDYAAFVNVPPVGANSRVYQSVMPDLTSYRVSVQVGIRLNPAE